MIQNLTTCPKCGTKFDAGEVMQKQIESELKKNLEELEKTNALKLEALEKKFIEDKKSFELEEKKKMWAAAQAAAQKQADEKNAAMLIALKEENQLKQNELLLSRQKEVEFMKKENELKNQQALLKITLEKQLLEKSKEIEEIAKKRKDDEFDLVKKEYEKKLNDQLHLIDQMKRKAEQGSMQMQGEVQELALEELLAKSFVFDKIDEVGKGVRGADVIQTVMNEFGQDCGKIIFESKRTQNFSNDWIDKLKEDQRQMGGEIAVLVTQTMPKDMSRFGQREGIWICYFAEVSG